MTPVTSMAGRRVTLFGLGGSGLATALALKAGGAEVVAGDDSPASLAKAEAAGIATADLRDEDWSGFVALVLAPGVPLTHPAPHWTVERAQAAGIEVIGDIELFCRERAKLAPHAPFVAITGTNGKSTTTALVAHILREAGRDVQMGGNIGTPIMQLEPPANDRVHVIELSSFQIDLTPSFKSVPASPRRHPEEAGEAGRLEGRKTAPRASRRAPGAPRHDAGTDPVRGSGPTVGVLLNITPDHLDRHGTMERYAAIKARVVAGADLALVGIDDEPSRAIFLAERAARPDAVLFVSGAAIEGVGYRYDGSSIIAERPGSPRIVADIAGIGSLRGEHNAQNAAMAVGIAEALGVDDAAIAGALRTFPGLPHRMEEVARIGPVLFINDSKATNADSAEKALLSFERVFWILGGKAKEGGIEPLRPLFTKVVKAYLIGEAAEQFAGSLGDAVPFSRCGTLERAVAEAAADAAASNEQDPVVLLSPACASYDQFPNFERRGDRFRDLVQALPGRALPGAER